MEHKDAELLILKKELLLKDKELKNLLQKIQDLKNLHSTQYELADISFEHSLLEKDKEILLMDEKMYDLRMQFEGLTKTFAPAAE